MNLRHWQHFLGIAESNSFSQMAARTGLAQPALSRAIRELEAQLGAQLFRRHGRGVTLTPAGELFRRRAETILGQIRELPGALSATHEPTGTVSFGLPQSMLSVLTIPLIAAFRARFPSVRLHVRESTVIQIRDALLSRELEIGVVSSPLIEPQLTTVPLVAEPMVLIGPPGARLGPARPVSLTFVESLPLILARRPNSIRIMIEHSLERIGLSPTVPIETDTTALAEFVRSGFGYSVVPSCFVRTPAGRSLPHAPIKGLEISWMIAHLHGTQLSIGAQHLQQMIEMQSFDSIARGVWKGRVLNATASRLQAAASHRVKAKERPKKPVKRNRRAAQPSRVNR